MRHRLMIGAALLALAACGRGGGEANKAEAAPANIVVNTPGARAEVRTGPGAVGAMPGGLPAYPGAQADSNVGDLGEATAGGAGIVDFRTGDAPAQVIAFYAAALPGAGYRIANRMDMGQTATLSGARGDGGAVNIVATGIGGVTQVQIVVTAGAG